MEDRLERGEKDIAAVRYRGQVRGLRGSSWHLATDEHSDARFAEQDRPVAADPPPPPPSSSEPSAEPAAVVAEPLRKTSPVQTVEGYVEWSAEYVPPQDDEVNLSNLEDRVRTLGEN